MVLMNLLDAPSTTKKHPAIFYVHFKKFRIDCKKGGVAGDADVSETHLHPIIGESLAEFITDDEEDTFGVGQLLDRAT